MTERRKPDQEIIHQLEQVLRVIEWSQDVGYVASGDIDGLKAWLADYIDNLRDQSAN